MRYMEIPIRAEGSLDYIQRESGESCSFGAGELCSSKSVKLETYLLDTPAEKIRIKKRPMILICPGGAYEKLSYREGEPVAIHFLNQGYQSCVLRYSVAPARHPAPLLEIGSAMKLIHENAKDWQVDTEKIILAGFSAGAHLAASLGVFWNREALSESLHVMQKQLRPAGMILSYPVISSEESISHRGSFENLLGERYTELKDQLSIEKQVTKDTPPCFIWHTLDDKTVPVENSFLLMSALKRAGVSAELHVFPEGEHGLSLADRKVERPDGSGMNRQCGQWMELACAWLETIL